jgi:hypothetical protein
VTPAIATCVGLPRVPDGTLMIGGCVWAQHGAGRKRASITRKISFRLVKNDTTDLLPHIIVRKLHFEFSRNTSMLDLSSEFNRSTADGQLLFLAQKQHVVDFAMPSPMVVR